MTTQDLEKRINRLDRLGRGMANEAALIRAADDPPLRQERLAYLAAVGDALEAVERARVTPARAVLRIRRDGTQPAA